MEFFRPSRVAKLVISLLFSVSKLWIGKVSKDFILFFLLCWTIFKITVLYHKSKQEQLAVITFNSTKTWTSEFKKKNNNQNDKSELSEFEYEF